MHPLVQSALKSAREGENNNAIGLLKQVLTANPGDIDAWLVLAAVVDHPQRKRQCLNRVLAIDPAHPLAREELDQMDRAEAGEMESYAKEPASDTALLDRDEVPPTGYASTSATFESGSAEPGAPPRFGRALIPVHREFLHPQKKRFWCFSIRLSGVS